jgi:hypothetical protein
MMNLSARHTKSTVWSVGCLRRVVKICFFLALATLAPPSHAQEFRSTQPPSAATNPVGNGPCKPGWPDRNYVPIKITDSLVLSIPLKYLRYEWLACRESASTIEKNRDMLARRTGITGAGFDFFLPDFGGYTIERFRKPFSVDEVQVAYVESAKEIEVDPNHPAHYPSNQLKNMLRVLADPDKYQDIYGLRCYDARILKTTIYCYSPHAGKDHKGILFFVTVPPYGPGVVNPQMWTDYFSKRYGGIEIYWRTNVKNLPHWRAIDAQIWKFLAAWNVAHTKSTTP